MTKLSPTFFGLVGEDGKFKLKAQDRQLFDLFVNSFPPGSELVLQVRRYRKNRSHEQNRYYWGVVIPIIQEAMGHLMETEAHAQVAESMDGAPAELEQQPEIDPEDVHDVLKFHFLRERVATIFERVKSTTDLNTMDFEDYLARVRTWASAELGVFIPLPNETDESFADSMK